MTMVTERWHVGSRSSAATATLLLLMVVRWSLVCEAVSSPVTGSSVQPEGPNVCEKEEEFNVTTLVHQPIPYKVKEFEFCLRVPPRCPVERTAYRTSWRNETKLVLKTVRVCCEGFAQVEGRCLHRVSEYHIVNGSQSSLSSVRDTLHQEHRHEAADGRTDGSSIGIWAGICLTLVLVIAFFMLILFQYKKKLHHVKQELNYVTYTTDRSGSSAGLSSAAATHAPSSSIYSQVTTTGHDSPSLPNNAVRHFVVNDLKAGQQSKESNLERAAVLKKEAAIEGPSSSDLPSLLPHKSHFPYLHAASATAAAAAAAAAGGPSTSGPSYASGYEVPDVPLPDLPPGPPLPPLDPNLYRSTSKLMLDKEPIYEELKEPIPSPSLPPTLSRKRSNQGPGSGSPQPSIASSSVYDAPRTLSRSSSRASSVADNSLIASTLSPGASLPVSPAKVSNALNATSVKIMNRLEEDAVAVSFRQPSSSSSGAAPSASSRGTSGVAPGAGSSRHQRDRLRDGHEDDGDADRSISEEKIYANDVNCHQSEI